jgi:hypothetical protein
MTKKYLQLRNEYFAAEELYRYTAHSYKLDPSLDNSLNVDAAYKDMGIAFDKLQEQYFEETSLEAV